MTEHLGNSKLLFKYVSPESGRAVLENFTFRLSQPTLFNDPFDCQVRLRYCPPFEECVDELRAEIAGVLSGQIRNFSPNSVISEKIRWIARRINTGIAKPDALNSFLEGMLRQRIASPREFEQEIHEKVTRSLASAKILCLTKTFDSLLMWSHYASEHRGIVLGVTPRSYDSQFSVARPVEYSDYLPLILTKEEVAKSYTGQVSLGDYSQVKSILERVIYTKSTHWSYEQEWRMMVGDGFEPEKETEFVKFSPLDLDCIILGCRVDDSLCKYCFELRDKRVPHMKLFQAEKAQDRFGLEFRECE